MLLNLSGCGGSSGRWWPSTGCNQVAYLALGCSGCSGCKFDVACVRMQGWRIGCNLNFCWCHERDILRIPQIIDDYNHNMNGVDQADQLRVSYSTQLKALRNWLPLFFWILDTSNVNAFILFKFFHPNTSHHQFRLNLAKDLFKSSTNIVKPRIRKTYKQKTQTLYFSKYNKTLPPLASGPHNLIYLPTGTHSCCAFCRFSVNKYSSTRFACSSCAIPLCKSNYFDQFHVQ